MDWKVVKFLTSMQYARAAISLSRENKLQIINDAIKQKKQIEIVYLKAKDEKSRRTILPLFMGDMEYNGNPYLGLEAYCRTRRQKRIFNVDRILDIIRPV